MMWMRPAWAMLVLVFCFASVAGAEPSVQDWKRGSEDGVGIYKVGKPYKIAGEWYYPKTDYGYDETGIASWYGDAFHEYRTANGELYNKYELTAAHKTLPLPSLARVTNLDNGRSVVVRINDRGPFSGGRVIDVSERVAELLNFRRIGTAKVRVQILAAESKAIASAMRRYGQPANATVMAMAPVMIPPDAETGEMPHLSATDINRLVAMSHPKAKVTKVKIVGPQRIYVQAGAFSKIENANKLKSELAKKHITRVRISDATVRGKLVYRVQVGPIYDVHKADKVLKRVQAQGLKTARIVVN